MFNLLRFACLALIAVLAYTRKIELIAPVAIVLLITNAFDYASSRKKGG